MDRDIEEIQDSIKEARNDLKVLKANQTTSDKYPTEEYRLKKNALKIEIQGMYDSIKVLKQNSVVLRIVH